MDIDTSQAMDEINLAIGRAVSSLISSGKNSILEQLRESERQAVDGMKKVYAGAISMVTGRAIVTIG